MTKELRTIHYTYQHFQEYLLGYPHVVRRQNGTTLDAYEWCAEHYGECASTIVRSTNDLSSQMSLVIDDDAAWDHGSEKFYFKDIVAATHFKLRFG